MLCFFSLQNKHLLSLKQFIVQVQKQESPTAAYLYSLQLGLGREINKNYNSGYM